MASNLYAKSYRTESRTQKNDEFAFISYMNEPNSFSVVSVKRLIDVDQFKKGSIREKNKNYRISVEQTGTLIEMEQLAKEAEERSAYTMNADVVSDTEEWHKRKKSITSNNKEQSHILDKRLSELDSFDFDGNRTYTTLTTCVLDEVNNNTVTRARASFDDDDESSEETDDEDQENSTVIGLQNLTSTLGHKLTSKSKKRKLTTLTRQVSPKRSRTNEISSPNINQNKVDDNQSLSSTLKDLNHGVGLLRKQLSALTQSVDKHKETLNLILQNQKKMAKAMRNHQIPVLLADESESQGITTTNDNGVIYEFSNGDKFDLLRISADRSKPNKFVLTAIEKIFKNETELLDMDPRSMDTDDRITIIRDAVKVKFGLKDDELVTVWPPMLECIKSKRRNTRGKIRKSVPQADNNNLIITSENQVIQATAPTEQNLNSPAIDE